MNNMASKSIQRWLLSPWIILPSIVGGAAIGLLNAPLATLIAPFGEIYLKLLQMCVLPLMITAVITSLGNMLHTGEAKVYIKRLFIIFALALIVASAVGIASGVIFNPGTHLSDNAKTVLSEQITETEKLTKTKTTVTPDNNFINFIHDIVPNNIFYAISNGQSLSILFVCVLFGIALGKTPLTSAQTTLTVLDSVYTSFLKIIDWIMYGLPLGLCFLFAGYISQIGWPILAALAKLIIVMTVGSLLLIIVSSIIVWRYTTCSYFQSLQALKTPLLIAFSTSSSFAALPTTLSSLQNNLKLNKSMTDLVVPLGITLNQQGGTLHFALTAIFIAQVYGHALLPIELLLTLITSIFAAISISGIPLIAGVSMFALVLEPLGLPAVVGIILLTAIEPIIDPLLTVVNVYGNCAAAALVAHHTNKQIEKTQKGNI